MPHLIILDIMLPDMDGYEVCRRLRTQPRTSHVPIIFLSQKDDSYDKIQGLELGADDYVTKPFDIEELRLRVNNAIARSLRESLIEPHTNLPSGRLIEDQLRRIIQKENWALMDIRLNNFNSFKEVYGFVAGDDVLRSTGLLIGEVLDELGTENDFLGHIGGDNFMLITEISKSQPIYHRLKERFSKEVLAYYSFSDRQQGYLRVSGEAESEIISPLMYLSLGIVFSNEHQFTDIREITEQASEARRLDQDPLLKAQEY
jgi:PleD family two-component response regulator